MFVALTAPDIVCPDRRQHVLPLLFARPLTGVDYVLAKVGAMFAILFAFAFLPQVVLFVGQMLVSDDGALRYARDNAEVIWQVPVAVALLSIFYASIGVAIASLTIAPDHRRRVDHRALPRHLDRVRRPRRASRPVSESDEGTQFSGPPATIVTEDGDDVVRPRATASATAR